MEIKIKHVPSPGQEAHHLAGHPTHSLAKFAAISVGTSTAASVASYQLNRKAAHFQHDPVPPVSTTTGGLPDTTGEDISRSVNKAHKGYSKAVRRASGRKDKKGGK